MEGPKIRKERRRSPRMRIDLPVEYRLNDSSRPHGGIAVNASEVGLLIRSVRDIPVGTRLSVVILFPKGFELADFSFLAEIVWKNAYWMEEWQGYQYGIRITKILREDERKLKHLLSGRFEIGEGRVTPE